MMVETVETGALSISRTSSQIVLRGLRYQTFSYGSLGDRLAQRPVLENSKYWYETVNYSAETSLEIVNTSYIPLSIIPPG